MRVTHDCAIAELLSLWAPIDTQGSDAVHAFVVSRSPVPAAELQQLVTDTLNEMWSPAAVDFVDSLPLTRIAKVDKVALRKLYAELHTES